MLIELVILAALLPRLELLPPALPQSLQGPATGGGLQQDRLCLSDFPLSMPYQVPLLLQASLGPIQVIQQALAGIAVQPRAGRGGRVLTLAQHLLPERLQVGKSSLLSPYPLGQGQLHGLFLSRPLLEGGIETEAETPAHCASISMACSVSGQELTSSVAWRRKACRRGMRATAASTSGLLPLT